MHPIKRAAEWRTWQDVQKSKWQTH